MRERDKTKRQHGIGKQGVTSEQATHRTTDQQIESFGSTRRET